MDINATSCQDPVPVTGIQPMGYQGAAQHTYTRACDGFHEPGRCKDEAPVIVQAERAVTGMWNAAFGHDP